MTCRRARISDDEVLFCKFAREGLTVQSDAKDLLLFALQPKVHDSIIVVLREDHGARAEELRPESKES